MAIQMLERSQLRLVFEVGIDPSSQKPILKRKTFNNIKTDANAEQLYAIAEAVATLQEHNLHSVERSDHSNIYPQ